LGENEGLLLKPCRSIHTFFMAFPIDAAFVDNEDRVCFLLENMGPCRVSPYVLSARFVLEAPAGTWRAAGLAQGDELVFGKG